MSCWSVWWRRFIVAQQIKSIMSRFGAPALFNAPFPPANGMADDGNSAPWIKEAFHGKASHPVTLYTHWGSIFLCVCARWALQICRVRRSLQTGRLHPKKRKTRRRCWMYVGSSAFELCSKQKRIMGGHRRSEGSPRNTSTPEKHLTVMGLWKSLRAGGAETKLPGIITAYPGT